MKPLSIILVFCCFAFNSFSQVSGDIKRDGRKIAKDIKYTMNFAKPGKIVYKIVVDQNGNVKTCLEDEAQSTLRNTPMMMRGRDLILNHLKFGAGVDYPQLHKGFVTITMVQ